MAEERKLNELEKRAGRHPDYWQLSSWRQWKTDKLAGILDWDGTEEWLEKRGK